MGKWFRRSKALPISFGEKGKEIYTRVEGKVKASLRLEILFSVVVALSIATLAFILVKTTINHTDMGRREYISYEESRKQAQHNLLNMVQDINAIQDRMDNGEQERTAEEITDETGQSIVIEIDQEDTIKEILSQGERYIYGTTDANTYLIDNQGKMMYHEGIIEGLDIIKVIQKVNNSAFYSEDNKFTALYPVIINNEVYYLFNESILEENRMYAYTGLGNIMGFVTAIGVFTALLFKLLRHKIDYIEYLSHCLQEISKGNLSYKIEAIGEDELAQVAKNITYMESEIQAQIEAQIQAEKIKNELVTNVAHDLRTPLTSIIGYIGLVKDKQFKDQEDEAKYLEIAYSKAEKLKRIIEDLFELTKLHQQEGKLKKEVISLTRLINQLVEEIMPLANEKSVSIEADIEGKEANIRADIPKVTRVFENLIENAIKYSQEKEAISIQLKELPKEVVITISNRCADIPKGEVDKLFERFYRGDQSRNSMAGGSGLGLAIAKNIVGLHGGIITASLQNDLISFKVRLPKYRVVERR